MRRGRIGALRRHGGGLRVGGDALEPRLQVLEVLGAAVVGFRVGGEGSDFALKLSNSSVTSWEAGLASIRGGDWPVPRVRHLGHQLGRGGSSRRVDPRASPGPPSCRPCCATAYHPAGAARPSVHPWRARLKEEREEYDRGCSARPPRSPGTISTLVHYNLLKYSL